jgi:hypothetical protein
MRNTCRISMFQNLFQNLVPGNNLNSYQTDRSNIQDIVKISFIFFTGGDVS